MNNKHFNDIIHCQLANHQGPMPYWVEMICDLVDGMDYTYSRIAKRIGVVPSTIQKLATRWDRKPRRRVFHALLCLYYKVFYSECRLPQADHCLKLKEKRALINKVNKEHKN